MRLFIAASLLAAGFASAEDLTIVSNVTRNGEPAGTQTSYLSAEHIRMAQPEGQELILDNKTGNMTMLDTKKKEYSVITPEDLQLMLGKMQEQSKKMEEQMKNMPPQARAMMEKMGGGGSSMVTKTGPVRKIAGYSCETWTISLGEMARTEQCLSAEVAVPTQAWGRYKDFAEQMQSTLHAIAPRGPGVQSLKEKMSGMQGYPLSVVTNVKVLGKSSTTASEVTEIKKGPIPASAFEIPAGFKQVDSPMKKMLK
jgi:hypothetical protein